MSHNIFKGIRWMCILTVIDVASRCKIARPLKTKKSNEVALELEAIYKKGGVFKYPRVFQCDNGSEFKKEVTKSLGKHGVEIRRATTKYKLLIQPLLKPLTKSWQGCCLDRWMLKSFKTLKKYPQFGLNI